MLTPNCREPWYIAVIEREPASNCAKENDALPLRSVAQPIVVEPSKNETFPAGVPLSDFTQALKVTSWPKTEGFGEAVIVVVVASWGPVLFKNTFTEEEPSGTIRSDRPSPLTSAA